MLLGYTDVAVLNKQACVRHQAPRNPLSHRCHPPRHPPNLCAHTNDHVHTHMLHHAQGNKPHNMCQSALCLCLGRHQ